MGVLRGGAVRLHAAPATGSPRGRQPGGVSAKLGRVEHRVKTDKGVVREKGTDTNGVKIRRFWDEFKEKARLGGNHCSGRSFTSENRSSWALFVTHWFIGGNSLS